MHPHIPEVAVALALVLVVLGSVLVSAVELVSAAVPVWVSVLALHSRIWKDLKGLESNPNTLAGYTQDHPASTEIRMARVPPYTTSCNLTAL